MLKTRKIQMPIEKNTAASTITEISLTENRIINLENLRAHMQEVTQQ